jgi:hypothetical protein
MGARNRVGRNRVVVLPARLHTLAEWFLGIDSWAPEKYKIRALICSQGSEKLLL